MQHILYVFIIFNKFFFVDNYFNYSGTFPLCVNYCQTDVYARCILYHIYSVFFQLLFQNYIELYNILQCCGHINIILLYFLHTVGYFLRMFVAASPASYLGLNLSLTQTLYLRQIALICNSSFSTLSCHFFDLKFSEKYQKQLSVLIR